MAGRFWTGHSTAAAANGVSREKRNGEAAAARSGRMREPWEGPKWNPGEWKEGLKPAVPWQCNFDPYPSSHFRCSSNYQQLLVVASTEQKQFEMPGR